MKMSTIAWLSAAVLAVSVTARAAAPAEPAVAAPAKAAPHKVTRESAAENRAGFDLMKDRKYAEAIERFQKAVQIDPLNKTAWNSLGVCQLRMYETGMSGLPALEGALAAFQKVAEIDPAYHAENLANAQALVAQEKAWSEAAAKRAGQPARTVAATGDYRAYKAAGEAAEQEGDLAFAQANYEKAEAVAGSSKGKSAAANWQGLLALNKGRNPKAAVDHLRRATTLDPAYKYAWNNLGVALRRLYDAEAGGKELIEEAVAAFRKVSEIDPAYKPENLAEADALLTELGGPSAPAGADASATTTASAVPAAVPASPPSQGRTAPAVATPVAK
ncbi:MAG: tetratricopeptide repeat protein [Candidatus Coatesbacteria bacterium]